MAGHRTPGRRFPAPVKATGGKGHWVLGLTSSKTGQCPDSQSKLLQATPRRTAEPAPTEHCWPPVQAPPIASQDVEEPIGPPRGAPAPGPLLKKPHRSWGRPAGSGRHWHFPCGGCCLYSFAEPLTQGPLLQANPGTHCPTTAEASAWPWSSLARTGSPGTV